MVTPSRIRSSPARQVFCPNASSWYSARWGASNPQRIPTAETQSLTVARSSSVKENRRRTTAAAARSRTSVAVNRGTGQVDQPRSQRQQAIGLPQGSVGQLDPEPVRGVTMIDDLGQPEPGGDQRRVLLDIGTEHQHVPGLESRITLQQTDNDLAQDVDLAGRPMAGVDRQAPVVRICDHPLRGPVGDDVALQPMQQAVGRSAHRVHLIGGRRRQTQLQFAGFPTQRGQQRVPGQRCTLIQ